VLEAPGGNGASTAERTDEGGQAAVSSGSGPNQVANQRTTETRSWETTNGRLSDGTQWEENRYEDGSKDRTETMPDGRTHTTKTDASGKVTDETFTDPDGTSRRVEQLRDGSTRTTRTWSDGSKDVNRAEPDTGDGPFETENRFSPEGEHVQRVMRSEGWTSIGDLEDGNPTGPSTILEGGSAPAPPAPPMSGGGMSQFEAGPEAPTDDFPPEDSVV
jgi:hypothetical protein